MAAAGIVQSLEVVIAPQPMYNLTVDEAHTYFVGDGEWLVHNTCDGVITVPAGQGNRTLSLSDGTAITEGPVPQVVSQSEAIRIQDEWVGENAWPDRDFLHSAEAEPTTGLHHRARWDIDDNPPHLNLEAGTWINKADRISPVFEVAQQNGVPLNFHLYYTP